MEAGTKFEFPISRFSQHCSFCCRYGIEFLNFTPIDGRTIAGFTDRITYHRRERQLAFDALTSSEDEDDSVDDGAPPLPEGTFAHVKSPFMASQAAAEAASTMRTEHAKKVEKTDGARTGSSQKMKRTKPNSDTSQATSRPVQKPASSVPREAAVKQQAGTNGQGRSSANQESTGAKKKTTTAVTVPQGASGLSKGGLVAFLPLYRAAGLTRENWKEMQSIDYNQAVQLCFSVAPSSKKKMLPQQIQQERLFGTLNDLIQAGEMSRMLCKCSHQGKCPYKDKNHITTKKLDNLQLKCGVNKTCNWCSLINKRGSLLSSAFELNLNLAKDIKRMKEQVAANSPAREGQVSKLIEMMQECFNISRTRFFILVSVGALVEISPGIAAVTPLRKTTQFWTVFSKLGQALGNIESLCGKQFALALWICQTRCLAEGQQEGIPLWKQWLSALKWEEQDEKLDKVFDTAFIEKLFDGENPA